MSIWQRLWRRLRGEPVSEPQPIERSSQVAKPPPVTGPVPAPKAKPTPETWEERTARLKLERELTAIELAIEDIESCLVALDAREQHRTDDLGPIALAREGRLDDHIEISFTLSGKRRQVEELDTLLRHISHTTRLGQRQIYRIGVDAGGSAYIDAERDGEQLRVSEDEEAWTEEPPRATPHGRRINYGRDPLDLFVD